MSKGQIFLTDLVASVAVFSIFVMAFGVMWNTAIEEFEDGTVDYDRGGRTFNLLTTEGYPEDWNSSNVEVPGLYTDGNLNETKLLRLDNFTASEMRQLLRAQQYLIKAEYLNGTLKEKNGRKLRVNSSSIPDDRSVYTYRETSLTASDKKRIKLIYLMWDR